MNIQVAPHFLPTHSPRSKNCLWCVNCSLSAGGVERRLEQDCRDGREGKRRADRSRKKKMKGGQKHGEKGKTREGGREGCWVRGPREGKEREER